MTLPLRFSGSTRSRQSFIYRGAQRPPVAYSSAAIKFCFFSSYDDAGNLYLDGRDDNGNFVFAELPHDGKKLQRVTLDRSIGFPGSVQ